MMTAHFISKVKAFTHYLSFASFCSEVCHTAHPGGKGSWESIFVASLASAVGGAQEKEVRGRY